MEPTNLPWSDPNSDPMADIGDYLRRQYESYPSEPFKPYYTPAEQRVLDEWNKKNEAD